MLNIDDNKLFAEVVETAKVRTGGDARWVAAIDRAAREIASNPMMHWQPASQSMLIQSPDSSEVYEANGHCQCKAAEFGKACWHRASARLWMRYLEALSIRLARSTFSVRTEETAVLVAPAARKVERVRGFQI